MSLTSADLTPGERALLRTAAAFFAAVGGAYVLGAPVLDALAAGAAVAVGVAAATLVGARIWPD